MEIILQWNRNWIRVKFCATSVGYSANWAWVSRKSGGFPLSMNQLIVVGLRNGTQEVPFEQAVPSVLSKDVLPSIAFRHVNAIKIDRPGSKQTKHGELATTIKQQFWTRRIAESFAILSTPSLKTIAKQADVQSCVLINSPKSFAGSPIKPGRITTSTGKTTTLRQWFFDCYQNCYQKGGVRLEWVLIDRRFSVSGPISQSPFRRVLHARFPASS